MFYIKNILLLFTFIICNSYASNSQNITNKPFKEGENLKYEMSYGWITGGIASLDLSKVDYKGKKVFFVKALGKTTGIANSIYNVKDYYESYFDIITGKPYKSKMSLKEGKYRNYNEVFYNHSNNTVYSLKSGQHNVNENIFDIISAFYHLRESLNNLNIDDIVTIHTYFHDEPWDLVVRFKGYETIKIGLGKINCMKFKPVVEKGTFEDENALDIWISNDKNRIPVRVKMKFFVGSFKTDLIEYSGLVNEINFQ
ncbi:MAG: DUF3108 domain-containing protein [Bacteroidales bacterium]|nr:DUF3108 domain-containing protein [Bacteroidales bacterium]MBN2756716.1 DUF3108 domain-containing protein [Bacteroidales bacterium]